MQDVDLALTKNVDDANPNEGDTVNYTIVLANNGPDLATNIGVTDFRQSIKVWLGEERPQLRVGFLPVT